MAGELGHQQQPPHAQGAEAIFEGETELPATPPTEEEKTLALVAHLGALFGSFLVPLLILLVKRDSRFVSDQAREALNFQITILLAAVASILLIFLLVGIALLPLVAIYHLIGCILASVAAWNGKMFRYRFCLRVLK